MYLAVHIVTEILFFTIMWQELNITPTDPVDISIECAVYLKYNVLTVMQDNCVTDIMVKISGDVFDKSAAGIFSVEKCLPTPIYNVT
jgi:hypothetical protein